jgi:hypothetical protein
MGWHTLASLCLKETSLICISFAINKSTPLSAFSMKGLTRFFGQVAGSDITPPHHTGMDPPCFIEPAQLCSVQLSKIWFYV